MRFLIAVFLLSVFCHNPVAAQFPVQANLQIVPPYSPYLSDYAGGNGDRLVLTLLLNESPTVLLPVRLRFRISGTPLFGRDASFLLPNPIELQGGIPVRFSGADLTSYFNHWNMGLQTDRLPDGLYNFEFEALDTQRGIAVSDKARASLWIVLGKAPQLNFPVQNSIVQALDPQNVSFSWVARSLSPNSTFQTSYRFTLVEIVPSDREANEAILTTRPLYEEEITGTGLLYGISHPPLEKGRRYAWRVRAVDGSGRDYFENSGFSEVYSFIYGTDCGIPVNIEATPVSPTEVRWKGTGGSGNSAAVLRYRKAGGDKEWKSQNQLLASSGAIDLKVTGLAADTEYEYELGALCSNCRVKQSEKISGRVRTTKADSAAGDFECGRVPTLDYAEIEDMTPYPGEFKKGDTVRAADSELILTSVRNTGPGRITGRAVVFIPAFKNAGFTAEFDNVLINKYKRLVKMEGNAMYIRSVGVGEESASQMATKIGNWIDRLDTNFTDTYYGLMELGKIESKARGFLEKANLDDSLKKNLGELLDFLEDAVEDFRQAVQDKDPERIKEAKKRVNLALRLLRKFVRKPDEEIDVNMLVGRGNLVERRRANALKNIGNDFFDLQGNFLGSDGIEGKAGIYIITHAFTFVIQQINSKDFSSSEKWKDVASLITEYAFKNKAEFDALTNILSHYNQRLGYDSKVLVDFKKSVNPGSIMFVDKNEWFITITTNGGYYISAKELLYDKNNLMNDLIHENHHYYNHKGKEVGHGEGSINHLQAYYEQITTIGKAQEKLGLFIHTTTKFKEHIYENVGNYIASIPDPTARYQQKILFENLLGVVYNIIKPGQGRYSEATYLKK